MWKTKNFWGWFPRLAPFSHSLNILLSWPCAFLYLLGTWVWGKLSSWPNSKQEQWMLQNQIIICFNWRQRVCKTRSSNPDGAGIVAVFSSIGKYSKCYLFAAVSLVHHVTRDTKMLYKKSVGLKDGIHFLLLLKIISANKSDTLTQPKRRIWALPKQVLQNVAQYRCIFTQVFYNCPPLLWWDFSSFTSLFTC